MDSRNYHDRRKTPAFRHGDTALALDSFAVLEPWRAPCGYKAHKKPAYEMTNDCLLISCTAVEQLDGKRGALDDFRFAGFKQPAGLCR